LFVTEAGDAEAQSFIALVERFKRSQAGDPDVEAACDEDFGEIMALRYSEAVLAPSTIGGSFLRRVTTR
jgi:hypothetical protein